MYNISAIDLYTKRAYSLEHKKCYNIVMVRPSFTGIGVGSGILLELVLFADRTNAEPKYNMSTVFYGTWEIYNDLNVVCAFF